MAEVTLGGRVFTFGGGTVIIVPATQAFSWECRPRSWGSSSGLVRTPMASRQDRSATWSGAMTASPAGRCSGSTRVTSRVSAAGQLPGPAESLKTADPG